MNIAERFDELKRIAVDADKRVDELSDEVDKLNGELDDALTKMEGLVDVTLVTEVTVAARHEMEALARESLAKAVAYADEIFARLPELLSEEPLTPAEVIPIDPTKLREMQLLETST